MKRSEPLYFNDRDETVVEFRTRDGQSELRPVAPELAAVPFESVSPIRSVSSWPGKRNYEGDYWALTMRSHVHFESLLEREFAMQADFDTSVLSFQWQPMVMKWPRATRGQRGHVPDYFCRLDTGDGLVVDVKRPDRVVQHEEQFRLTREVCEDVGWQYTVFTGLTEPRRQNLTYLCGFRQDRYQPPSELVGTVLGAFSPGAALRMSVLRAARETGEASFVVQGWVLHLLWEQSLYSDLDLLLDDNSIVSTPTDAGSGGDPQ